MLQVGIIGGAGYTAGELIRLLLNHPETNINFVFSTSNAGNKLYKVHQDLVGSTEISFTSEINADVDVLFLCLGHGNSTAFLQKNSFSDNTKIIDLSNDFRLLADKNFEGKEFVYGLPELDKEAIKKAKYIANPGCFATALQLAILPLAANGLLKDDVHINAVTGATGAGTSLSATTHFTWRDNNFSHYKAFNHQHLGEINQTVNQLQSDFNSEINFMPNRGDFSRGIFATTYTKFDGSLEDAKKIYKEYYKDAAFTIVSDESIFLKQVVNTNKCLVQLEKHGNKLLITSTIDNLLKGASGAAIQNLNLMYGFEETEGLQLKANYF
ncbi:MULTISPECIES: N-acetyl-gamma-glutamyl-phosphate reductase [Tenacibaculum]|uniref:N-acetyl-gamma-glutamyl-phosphate reductase n=1 Tax=Tenacibaculum TaxID=104267 RepID=UPI001F0A4E82|nr:MULTISPECIES: N-acetyl-gamma-glutamyl-phosphate reductase [Tenacibaculum]MCH3881442.1 N-acetyl-gamma-glutamyl-phosphate reductase [Tenacibaculum aquimarinum]MCH3883658.1 N-acetyl-gamma-glutamyl-phosphate reductase [Tenacibaculum aquimarinum]MDO6598964.1 N-acetyl-gamma-glutamyl-phosphate reductase [Tenacibaculum sp. 1_MG-2023]